MSTLSVRGRVLTPAGWVDGAVVTEDGRIAAVRRAPVGEGLPAPVIEAPLVAPGYVDLQVNGGWGVEVGDGADAIRTLAARLPETGVTAWLPTRITAPLHEFEALFGQFDEAREAPGARPLGLHLEGPFLSPARKGAHPLECIEGADAAWLPRMLGDGRTRLMTLAPERPDGAALIAGLREAGVVVSLGHTDATFDELRRGVDGGATLATHLYNAMRPLGHREPGAVGGVLMDDRLTACIIADGVHVHPAAVGLAVRAKGPERLVLVSDMVAATGMPPGRYALGGREVVSDGDSVRLPDGTLAGSLLTMDGAVRTMVSWGLATPAEALRMAGELPARALGLESKGRIEPGRDADLVLLDAELRVLGTVVGGEVVYRRETGGDA